VQENVGRETLADEVLVVSSGHVMVGRASV